MQPRIGPLTVDFGAFEQTVGICASSGAVDSIAEQPGLMHFAASPGIGFYPAKHLAASRSAALFLASDNSLLIIGFLTFTLVPYSLLIIVTAVLARPVLP